MSADTFLWDWGGLDALLEWMECLGFRGRPGLRDTPSTGVDLADRSFQ
ncbi:hypothetical protein LOD44_00720 [Xylella fastidiosa subsp. multiplex]|nr:hypothetical protein [Xylella fastidiosa]MDD0862634.1 hypothetical protein [Xylella fastidiosa subsp. multiplex]MDD0880227.1 hypothetical protein [Xylella fastidiosa subsp. multiplex]MDD0884605.1 hypothetical protein [Xylella fastidiosa subsp. multiplex]MDD0888979.1 hypothetical protein [Xylella fastidiosa subsp. multiplex]MDD0890904.1 hypothetical protein [Xylella fastidiosa subsp. multiplex]